MRNVNIAKVSAYAAGVAYAVLISAGIYAHVDETLKPQQVIGNAVVRSVKEYHTINEITGVSGRVDVALEGMDRLISFRPSDWERGVREGDNVSLVVREQSPLFGQGSLDGLEVRLK